MQHEWPVDRHLFRPGYLLQVHFISFMKIQASFCGLLHMLRQALDERMEFQIFELLSDGRKIGLIDIGFLPIQFYWGITEYLCELPAHAGVLLVGFEFGFLRAFEFIDMFVDAVERAVFCQQRLCSFRADTFDTGNIVTRIANQRLVVNELFQLHTVFFFKLGLSEAHHVAPLLVDIDAGVFAQQLHHIVITAHYAGFDIFFGRLDRYRTNDVIGLVIIDFE